MLSDAPLDTLLLATDMDAAKDFYATKLGLEIVDDSPESISFKLARGNRLLISKSTVGTADTQTKLQWRVDDLAAVLADLQSRGVKIEEYDDPGFKTVDGVFDAGFGLLAWIVDPGKNTLALLQYK